MGAATKSPEVARKMQRQLLPLVAIIALIVMAGVNGGGFLIMQSQQEDLLSRAENDNRNLVNILARQTDRLFQSLDIVERNIVEKFDTLDIHNSEALRIAARKRFMHDILVNEKSTLTFVTWLSIVDDQGELISTSKQFPAPQFQLRERDYFRALSQPGGPKTFVSAPVANRDDGKLTMFVARRIENASGDFMGIVLAGVEPSYFRDIFDGLSVRSGSEIFLLREDGVTLASRSLVGGGQATAPLSGWQVAPDDGVMQVHARLESYPICVLMREKSETVLVEWRHEAAFVVAMIVALNLSAILAGVLGLRYVRQTRRLGRIEHYTARHDVLTGLPNRTFFQEKLDNVTGMGSSAQQQFGLLLLDLDKFKDVNDSQGHQAGDELLVNVARRLQSCLGPNDFLARLGGDEFAIIVGSPCTAASLWRFGQSALGRFKTPFIVSNLRFSIGASIGAALGSTEDDTQRLFDQADMALYQAKESGRGTMRFFSAELSLARQEQNALAADITEAVRHEAFELYFQPVVDLSTCRLIGFEALLRWNDPCRGSVPPSTFIPIAEATGAIGPLGAWALREACRQASTWPGHLSVAVNLSPLQFQFGNVTADVERALTDTGLPATRLEIEITESVRLDQPNAQTTLRAFANKAISVSLDDFGTGYSSLSYLRSFPFDRLKIDRSFVSEMTENLEAAAIVRSVKELAGRLGMAVTAEGIETLDQLRLLRSIGCNAGQGYLFSKPMPAGEVAGFIASFNFALDDTDRLRMAANV